VSEHSLTTGFLARDTPNVLRAGAARPCTGQDARPSVGGERSPIRIRRTPRREELIVTIVPLADPAGHYVNWWVVHISVTNLTIILVMVVVFFAALLLPFPGHDEDWDEQ